MPHNPRQRSHIGDLFDSRQEPPHLPTYPGMIGCIETDVTPVQVYTSSAVLPTLTFPVGHLRRSGPDAWNESPIVNIFCSHLDIHVWLEALFYSPAMIVDLFQELLLIFIRSNNHGGCEGEILQKTLLSFSDCIFRKKIVSEFSIFNKDYEGRSSSFEQKAPLANCLSKGGLKLHLRRRWM